MQTGVMGTISFEVHFDADTAENDVCDRLQEWLRVHSPRFASDLRVLAYERDPGAVSVDVSAESSLHQAMLERGLQRGATFQALSGDGPPGPSARRFGSALIRGKAPKSFLGMHFDQFHPGMPMGDKWLWSNSLSGHIEASVIDRVPAAEWVGALVEAFAQHPAMLWAAAYSSDEWHDRNMHDGADGMWALGRDIRRSLPGLFWLNVFGKPYIDHIGRSRLLALPMNMAEAIGDAVLVRLYETPDDWSSDESRSNHQRTAERLGVEHFFDRRFPDRPTSAPDFGLAELAKPGRTLQVFAGDDWYLTDLPPLT